MKKIALRDIMDKLKAQIFYNNKKIEQADGIIECINTLENAEKNHITFLGAAKYASMLKNTKSNFILIEPKLYEQYAENISDKYFIVVKNAYFAFANVIGMFEEKVIRKGISEKASVSKSASCGKDVFLSDNVFIGENSKIGDRTVIYPGVVVEENVCIGSDCIIYSNAVIRKNCVIGDNVILHPGTVIGADGFGFAQDGGKIHKIPQIGNVVIFDNVEIGANVTIDRGVVGPTIIGENTKIDNLVHIAHNVEIGKNCFIVAQVGISGTVKIGNNVRIAGQAGIVGHISVGDNTTVAARSVVMNDIDKNSFVSGFPAINHNEDMKLKV
ncbi:MAG: UDP-3-O-(3-hydroxymyristoyl)glucosamine N-acyltransferase, partial [Candidatus Muiribacteriota bacterium]